MDFQWIFNGFSMDFQWIFNGFSMDFQWIFNGFSMDSNRNYTNEDIDIKIFIYYIIHQWNFQLKLLNKKSRLVM